MNTRIQWTDETWNVATGCTRVSAGCDNCYIERTIPFRMAGRKFDKPGVGGATGVLLHEDRLSKPLRWRKPRRVFVNSMSDLFHEAVPDDLLVRVFDTMQNAPRNIFQILTKRPARMRSFVRRYLSGEFCTLPFDIAPQGATIDRPPRNVWLGVSVEDQHWADIRIPVLLDTPAAVRWISAEPLLGPVDLRRVPGFGQYGHDGTHHGTGAPNCSTGLHHHHDERCAFPLDWAVVGGESGPGARQMDLDWARTIVRQLASSGAPVFVKQLGSVWAKEHEASDRKGGNPGDWPADLRVREFPEVSAR